MFQIPQDSSSDKSLRELYQMFVGANVRVMSARNYCFGQMFSNVGFFFLFQGENDTIDLRPYLVLCCFMYSVGEVNLLQRLIFRVSPSSTFLWIRLR